MIVLIMLLVSSTAATITAGPTAGPTVSLQWINENCVGGERGLLSTGLRLTLNASNETGLCHSNTTWIDYNSSLPDLGRYCELCSGSISNMTFEFEQPEHGGGTCHCVQIDFHNPNGTFRLCHKTANETREVSVLWTPTEIFIIPMEASQRNKTLPYDFVCSDSQTRLSIVFNVHSNRRYCNGHLNNDNSIGDDMEVSIRFLSNPSEWIPLAVIKINDQTLSPTRHGYVIPYIFELNTTSKPTSFGNVTICNFPLNDSFQLRWLVASHVIKTPPRDVWSLDDIEITIITEVNNSTTLLEDSFDMETLNQQFWSSCNIRNGRVSMSCSVGINNSALTFGESFIFVNNTFNLNGSVLSHAALTNIFSIENLTLDETRPSCKENVPSTITSAIVALTCPMTTPANTRAEMNKAIEKRIRDQTLLNPVWSAVYNNITIDRQLQMLFNITARMNEDLLESVYIFSDVLDNLTSNNCNQEIVQVIANIGNNIILQSFLEESLTIPGPSETPVIGPTLLQSIEEIVIPCTIPTAYSTNQTTAIEIRQVNFTQDSIVFNASTFSGFNFPSTSFVLQLQELKEIFTLNNTYVIIDVLKNVSNILPDTTMNFTLVSDVIGISLRCGKEICPTSNISLDRPVVITFQHSPSLTGVLENNKNATTICSFLKITPEDNEGFSVLTTGTWSTINCSKNEALSSKQATVCECTHLTHFGILLSARPIIPEDPAVVLSLDIIGYVGVSVSVAAMLITVILFLVFKSLRGLRTFIHVNLCINLAIAQIIFVAGVDKTSENSVPIHCQIIAVLLHYFFLVSFMWMLMEGVFLYITLVKVFVKSMKPYYVAFTLTSYGLPLLYMGGLTLPIGYKAYDETQYGYNIACFLSPEKHFVWVFIVPATLIFLTNIGFFIMAATIMWRHQNKMTEKNKMTSFVNWFKAACSLTIVMGITWIIGIILVVTEGLLFLVYIYTIMVAFQGVFIFLLYVILSKAVKDAVTKWWTVQVNESDILNKYFGEKLSSISASVSANKSSEKKKFPQQTALQNDQINLKTAIPNPNGFHASPAMENMGSNAENEKSFNTFF